MRCHRPQLAGLRAQVLGRCWGALHSGAFTVFLNALLLCCRWQVPNLCAGHRAHCTALAGQAATTPKQCVQHGWTAAAQPSRHGGSGKCERITQKMLPLSLELPYAATLRLQPQYRQLSQPANFEACCSAKHIARVHHLSAAVCMTGSRGARLWRRENRCRSERIGAEVGKCLLQLEHVCPKYWHL